MLNKNGSIILVETYICTGVLLHDMKSTIASHIDLLSVNGASSAKASQSYSFSTTLSTTFCNRYDEHEKSDPDARIINTAPVWKRPFTLATDEQNAAWIEQVQQHMPLVSVFIGDDRGVEDSIRAQEALILEETKRAHVVKITTPMVLDTYDKFPSILHFTGHGSGDGIACASNPDDDSKHNTGNNMVYWKEIGLFIKQNHETYDEKHPRPKVQVVFLNSCYSEDVRQTVCEMLGEYRVSLISWEGKVPADAAARAAELFYSRLSRRHNAPLRLECERCLAELQEEEPDIYANLKLCHC
jgi:hypothetical protein